MLQLCMIYNFDNIFNWFVSCQLFIYFYDSRVIYILNIKTSRFKRLNKIDKCMIDIFLRSKHLLSFDSELGNKTWYMYFITIINCISSLWKKLFQEKVMLENLLYIHNRLGVNLSSDSRAGPTFIWTYNVFFFWSLELLMQSIAFGHKLCV